MGDRAYANIQVQQKTLSGVVVQGEAFCSVPVPAASTPLLVVNARRAAISNPRCSVLKERWEPPSAPGAVPSSSPAQENGPSFNSSFDRASRFGYDFSQIPIHSPVAGVLQTKLAINQPGDQYEQEADRLSEHVMRMPDPQLHRACACGGACPKCQIEQPDRNMRVCRRSASRPATRDR